MVDVDHHIISSRNRVTIECRNSSWAVSEKLGSHFAFHVSVSEEHITGHDSIDALFN